MSSYYEYSYAIEEGLAVITGLLSGIPSTAFNIAAYVLTALALYTVAKRRGISKPWLAWIPVVNCWLVGSISDQYRYVVKGEIKSKRKVLLTLNILMTVLAIAICSCAAVAVVMTVISDAYYMADTVGLVFAVCGLALALAGIAIAYKIVYCMALYDVYTSMEPGNNVLFLVLSILCPVTEPFFLFFNRNKDGGMPPRREEPVYKPPQEPAWQPQQPVQEPWETEDKDYL